MTDPVTVAPLPPIIVGDVRDDSGRMVVDDYGNPIYAADSDIILSSIYALASEVRTMNDTINGMAATLVKIAAKIGVKATAE